MSPVIEVIRGDITRLNVDAIVNAANSGLLGGGGVDGAIHRAGGPRILEECMEIARKQGRVPAGGAVITHAGDLPCKYVIHAVGPVWQGGSYKEAQLLGECYVNSLTLAAGHQCRTVAFPNISTGVYGFPKSEAAWISHQAIENFVVENQVFDRIILVCYDLENYALLKRLSEQ